VSLHDDLRDLLNFHSREHRSHTPDYILAEYMLRSLENWEEHTRLRDEYWGHVEKAKESAKKVRGR
jgi:hypothetical protein